MEKTNIQMTQVESEQMIHDKIVEILGEEQANTFFR